MENVVHCHGKCQHQMSADLLYYVICRLTAANLVQYTLSLDMSKINSKTNTANQIHIICTIYHWICVFRCYITV